MKNEKERDCGVCGSGLKIEHKNQSAGKQDIYSIIPFTYQESRPESKACCKYQFVSSKVSFSVRSCVLSL
jgi:hypothetical protein